MSFRPTTTKNSYGQNLSQINDMTRSFNKEQQIKVFKGPNGTQAIIIGRYSEGRYGLLISDDTGTPRVLVGQAPDDGRPGTWISREGQDVLDLLS